MPQYNLVWFRQDLRVFDHTALHHAMLNGPSIALVVLSPQQWQIHHDAPIKIDFYLRQLKQLQHQLQQLNIPLLVLTIQNWADIADHILQLCKNLNIQNLYTNIEAGLNEIKRDQHVQKHLNHHHIHVHCYDDRTLFPLASIRNKSHLPYQVFGAFKKYCYQQLSISLATCYPTPLAQEKCYLNLDTYNTNIPSLFELMGHSITLKQQSLWPVGEDSAFALLDHFLANHIHNYQKERDYPNLSSTSRLSAYLNIGSLSIRACIHALFREQHGQFHFKHEGQQIWLDELLWREFYQHILFDFPQVSKHLPFKRHTQNIAWRDAPHDLSAWQQGQTGIPIVDAGIRQMLTTGWMHNRVRMIVAMFFSKNLLIDWRLGEAWFMQHLIDGDLAANNGGWQWCASTGTDSVPYFRIFNPISQSEKFDPQGDYLREWLPELAHLDSKTIHHPYQKDPNLSLHYPRPIVDLKTSRLRAIDAFKSLEKIPQ